MKLCILSCKIIAKALLFYLLLTYFVLCVCSYEKIWLQIVQSLAKLLLPRAGTKSTKPGNGNLYSPFRYNVSEEACDGSGPLRRDNDSQQSKRIKRWMDDGHDISDEVNCSTEKPCCF